MNSFISLDLPPLLTAVFSTASCAILGNFLTLRRQSLMGDAISHAVLPGIVVAFLITGSRDSLYMFVGAVVFALIMVFFVQLIGKLGRVEQSASMGVVFSILFAFGIFLMEQAAARAVDLDADCVLHGQLETIFWFPSQYYKAGFLELMAQVPTQVYTTFGVLAFVSFFVILLFKELTISTFDSHLAYSLGLKPKLLDFLLMSFVALAVVASFQSVGSILVIAMLICPGVTAGYFTDNLKIRILLSVLFSTLAVIIGYFFASYGVAALGLSGSLNAAGMIVVVSAVLFILSFLFSPVYGIFFLKKRRKQFRVKMLKEDILGFLYRLFESGKERITRDELVTAFPEITKHNDLLSRLTKDSKLKLLDGFYSLTESGLEKARSLIRTHRLWESYLVTEAGLSADHVHDTAMMLEHIEDKQIKDELEESVGKEKIDPQGKVIP